MKIYFYIVISLLLICSCKKESGIVKNTTLFSKEDFKQTISLKGKIIEIDSLWKPIRIWVHDSSLVSIDMYCDYFAQIYDNKNGFKKTENIPRGIGPGEFLNCWSLQFYLDKVWAFDMQQAKMNAYKISDFLNKKNISPVNSIKFNSGAPTSVAVLPDNSFLCSDLTDSENLVTHFDTLGNKDNKYQVGYPEVSINNIPENLKKRFWENRIYYNHYNNKIVIFYTYSDLIDIYNSDMKLMHRIQGPDNFIPILGNRKVENHDFAYIIPEQTKFAYLFGVLTDSEIWALYYGISPKRGEEMQHTIFVFDYQGNPLRHYELDIPITFFCVDSKMKYIYGLSEQPDPVIIRYQY
ncbi:BF3164 family lipoprotein [Parabacteroides johnsonii]|jgi:hypothetical protein|uniref:BF3164 family lipoprotein n=2 Tax=Parabacteroides johnsonii TaxID=387661 RepID=A0A9Q5X7C1_9BACT|nr:MULTISPECIES: BF3164 family lipoprotein [Bacteroidales]MDC7150318.1 BF3164 family lipoprotein [Parabacteroides johnsonii]MDC7158053.1 BF3164 family lipoprotein [Parabacteroides johnsonii]OUO04338.1 hypothetical protein B5F96_12875 [Parabacteroides johnsonii]